MSEELQSLVQIIELYGKGLGGLGRALRFSAKGAAKGVEIAQVKRLQHRMKLHYASEGTHNTMKLCDLEKMTGGRYVILNIPIEGEKELIPFYDRLKKMRVSFAELPDLKLGDGYTQIAYNPDDVENVRLVIDYYKKKLRETPKDIGIDEYMAMAGPDGRDYLDELAVKGYEGMMHVEQLEEIQNRINDKDYLPISINIESLLLREEKDAYIFRVPRGRTREVSSRAIRVKKEDCILLDEGQTVITCLDRQEDIFGYALDNRENPDFSEAVKLDVKELEKILWSDLGTKADYEAEYGEKPLGEFVRGIVGLDMNAAKQAFSEYLDSTNLDSRQIYFVNQIVEYIVHNGILKDLSVLQEPPFTDKGSVVELFTDLNLWNGIRKVIDGINANAIA